MQDHGPGSKFMDIPSCVADGSVGAQRLSAGGEHSAQEKGTSQPFSCQQHQLGKLSSVCGLSHLPSPRMDAVFLPEFGNQITNAHSHSLRDVGGATSSVLPFLCVISGAFAAGIGLWWGENAILVLGDCPFHGKGTRGFPNRSAVRFRLCRLRFLCPLTTKNQLYIDLP